MSGVSIPLVWKWPGTDQSGDLAAMAKRLDTIWDLEPHTAAKHAILRRYLQAWIPILSSAHQRIVYIDGFAGPGIYSRGEDGSPVIALKSALAHAQRISGGMLFLFVETDPKRKENLERCVSSLTLPANFDVRIELGECEEVITRLLDGLDRAHAALAPTFAFLDPFGFSHTSLALVQRLMSHQRCEVLITFMYEEINRFLSQEQMPDNFNGLFGCEAWKECSRLAVPSERKRCLRQLYQSQLEQHARIPYVRSFEMANQRDQTDYFLFFGTRSIDGLRKMKEAMWKVDEAGGYRFSDATDPDQIVLIGTGPDGRDLRQRLTDTYRGKTASIDELEKFVIEKTPYRETHLRRLALIPMESAVPPQLAVIDAAASRRKSTYPAGTRIRFV